MIIKKLFTVFFVLLCQFVAAQLDTITRLPEIVITDIHLKNFSSSQTIITFNDSVIKRNAASLTSLLNYNSVIYFKENGLGMVSSPSFRGTTAQQTAVMWNGININSQLNGQTDFNTLNTTDFNSIAVKAGGGSVIYGTGAIGGTIHLNSEVTFEDKFINEITTSYGSFNTLSANYKLQAGSDKFATQFSYTRNSSDNDYDYIGTQGKNLNGQYFNNSLNSVVAYKINSSNIISLYSYFFDDERHFSLIFPSENKTKYQDTNTRNMLEWSGYYGKFTSKLKAAHLNERYKYFQDIANPEFTYGKVETFNVKHDLFYHVSEDIKINTLLEITQNKGNGSDIQNEKRQIGSAGVLIKHFITPKLSYEAGLRKEATSNYKSPLLYSAGIKYTAFDFYRIKFNASKNFRIPTFNDLYWQDSGNPDLKPESSHQVELGNEFVFKDFTFSLTGYYINITDMLRWLPAGSVWRPVNTDKVKTYGLEVLGQWNKKITDSSSLSLNTTYGYTVSQDENHKQLMYVPFHKAASSLSWQLKKAVVYYQFLYNGKVFINSDNNPKKIVAPYNVSNIGAEYNFSFPFLSCVGFRVLNLWNEKYASVDSRPLPGRNFNMYLNLKF